MHIPAPRRSGILPSFAPIARFAPEHDSELTFHKEETMHGSTCQGTNMYNTYNENNRQISAKDTWRQAPAHLKTSHPRPSNLQPTNLKPKNLKNAGHVGRSTDKPLFTREEMREIVAQQID
ncbi:hypothetical protein M8997_018790 [Phyllobacterium sp. 21LDTY02-6]|uniref:hypothetical protein n=1 Tax=Phyllobacterium sp. 21LDTY02-6 TaxID=2944903 RepID=UPI00202019B6|nr:hypothetical protein [Phyllobacterium sp. 21LDTY02-6]MCO4319237.1 hypothetical protein [Phyllobacterium sp. 21LDTY02-6]